MGIDLDKQTTNNKELHSEIHLLSQSSLTQIFGSSNESATFDIGW